MTPTLPQRLWAEFLGTFWLVFGGCGSAVLAATFVTDAQFQAGIGFLGVALAFGLTVVTGAYALGHISGGHFNPAVTVGLWVAKRVETAAVLPYIVAQVVGASIAGGVLFVIASGQPGFDAVASGFATNGYADRPPGGYSLLAVLVAEVVLTAIFIWIILGVTSNKAPKGFAPLAIGLCAHAHPPHQHPGHEHVREPGPLHRSRRIRRRHGREAALALLGRSDHRRRARRYRLQTRRL